MHLCDILITKLEIPNDGLPLFFLSKIQIFLLKVYNFGKAAYYLFKTGEKEDGHPNDEECNVTFVGEHFQLSKEDPATIDAFKRSKTSPEPIIS